MGRICFNLYLIRVNIDRTDIYTSINSHRQLRYTNMKRRIINRQNGDVWGQWVTRFRLRILLFILKYIKLSVFNAVYISVLSIWSLKKAYSLPVDPKPPSPRTVSLRSETSLYTALRKGVITSWAIRSFGSIETVTELWLCNATMISPR